MDIYNKLNSKLMNNNSKFILNGRTFKDIFNLASGINEIFSSSADCNEVICVCTEDKSIIASALLASLGGGPEIALPYSLSDRVISDMKEELRFTKILTDNSTEIPSGMEAILPENIILSDSKVTLSRDPDSVFLKLFTGGTTGKPRVWSKTPRNILSEAEYLSQKFNITNDDLFAATVSPLHIYGLLFSVVIPFISSARIINDILSFPKEITSAIEDLSATILVSVPMHFRTLKMSSFHRNRLRLAFSSA
ncbi:MAG: AMP-binding protein, partial [Spirochaetota bacterium]|nr:AMP-binding protein [Spirochaetota bacterium]